MLFFSSYCIATGDIKKALGELIGAGIRNIELSNGQKYIFDIVTILEKLKDEYSLNFLIHNYFPPPVDSFVLNLASQDKVILNKTIEHCKRSIRLANLLDVPMYSVHAGFRIDPKPSELGRPLNQAQIASYSRAYSTMAESLKKLCEFAGKLNIDIAVENHEIDRVNLTKGKNELLLMCEADEYIRLFTDVKKDNLKILVDLGHLNVTATTLGFDRFGFIDRVKDKIALFHLSDNDGLEDEHNLISENSWFWPILKARPQIDCVIESCNLTRELIHQTLGIYQYKIS